jgi:putative hydrolases of HD superfamily
MVETGLILKLFESAYMQRWNDKLRPMEFYELDKQAHKMMIAYFFASFETGPCDLYIQLLKGSLFEFLQRIVMTDIKPPVFHMIQTDKDKYLKLNQYILSEIGDLLDLFGSGTREEFLKYFTAEDNSKARMIQSAAHIYSSMWEFNIIKSMNPDSYDNGEIENDLKNAYDRYGGLKGIIEVGRNENYRKFIQICGELRYQSRWAHLHRIPKTSVLGHSLFVAWLSYYFSVKSGCCRMRIYNNFVGALFHDLPETLTRDIISPIKRGVEGLQSLIRDYEEEQMERVIYPLLPQNVSAELRMIMRCEFTNRISMDGELVVIEKEDIPDKYDYDRFSPYDGEMVKACDDVAAYIEAASAISNGCFSKEFDKAKTYMVKKYRDRGMINGFDFAAILERINRQI